MPCSFVRISTLFTELIANSSSSLTVVKFFWDLGEVKSGIMFLALDPSAC